MERKNFDEIWIMSIPYIPPEVKIGLIPFVVYVPRNEYLFWFPERDGELIYGEPAENVVSMVEKRGPIEPPNQFRKTAFEWAYRIWKEWQERKSQLPLPL